MWSFKRKKAPGDHELLLDPPFIWLHYSDLFFVFFVYEAKKSPMFTIMRVKAPFQIIKFTRAVSEGGNIDKHVFIVKKMFSFVYIGQYAKRITIQYEKIKILWSGICLSPQPINKSIYSSIYSISIVQLDFWVRSTQR